MIFQNISIKTFSKYFSSYPLFFCLRTDSLHYFQFKLSALSSILSITYLLLMLNQKIQECQPEERKLVSMKLFEQCCALSSLNWTLERVFSFSQPYCGFLDEWEVCDNCARQFHFPMWSWRWSDGRLWFVQKNERWPFLCERCDMTVKAAREIPLEAEPEPAAVSMRASALMLAQQWLIGELKQIVRHLRGE